MGKSIIDSHRRCNTIGGPGCRIRQCRNCRDRERAHGRSIMGLLRHKHFWISRCRHGCARIAVCGTDIAVTAMVTMGTAAMAAMAAAALMALMTLVAHMTSMTGTMAAGAV